MHLQVYEEEIKGGNMRVLASPHWATGPGTVMWWARAHAMRMNSPMKFGPKPRKPTVSFLIEIDLVRYRTL
jgi:hypothetical protein